MKITAKGKEMDINFTAYSIKYFGALAKGDLLLAGLEVPFPLKTIKGKYRKI